MTSHHIILPPLASLRSPLCLVCASPGNLGCVHCPPGPSVFCSVAHYHEHWWQAHGGMASPQTIPQIVDTSIAVPTTPPVSASVYTPSNMVEVRQETVVSYVLGVRNIRPVFLSISCFTATLDGKQPFTVPELSSFFRHGRATLVLHFDRFGLPRASPLHLFYCTHSYIRHKDYNRAAATLVGGTATACSDMAWPGTVVILKYSSTLCVSYEDVVEADVADIRAYFMDHRQSVHRYL